jgi:hypothetical protein
MRVHISGQQRCEVTDIEVYFLHRFKFRYNKVENLEVTSLESCHLGIGLNIALTLRVDIEGREGVKRVTRNSVNNLVWLRSVVFFTLGRQKKKCDEAGPLKIPVKVGVWSTHSLPFYGRRSGTG